MIGCVTDVLENIEDCRVTVSKVLEKMSKLTNSTPPSSSLIQTLMYKIGKIENDMELCSNCLSEQFCGNDMGNQPQQTPEPSHYPDQYDWLRFKFVTKKKGAHGPSRSDCLRYYQKT